MGVTLLEREREMAAIRTVLKRGGVLLVEGGAGIGKTSLLGAATERAARTGHAVLRARGSELEAGFAFGVVRQLFERRVAESAAAERRALFSGPAAAARPLLTGDVTETSARDRAFAVLHGLYWLAANLAAVRPLVIAVDDAHWADGPSLRWVAYLAPRVEGLPVTLLLALRPEEAEMQDDTLPSLRTVATVVRPRLLSESAVADIVRDVIGAEASAELCAAAWRKTGGNPFYLRELLRADDGPVKALTRPGHGLAIQVATRLRRLDPHALRLAQAVAVLGDDCELRQAAALADVQMDTAMRLAAGLIRLEVLADHELPRFLHPVLREAVEASLSTDERDSAHRAAARLRYADRAPIGRVAAHLMRVRPAADHWVLARLREAAQAAVGGGAPAAGADLLRRALAEPAPLEERVEVLRETAGAEVLAGRQSACARLEEALQLVRHPRERAQVALELAQAHANLYRWAEAVDVCERTLAELEEGDQDLMGRLEAELVVCGLRDARRAAQALPVLERLGRRSLDAAAAEAFATARAIAAHRYEGRPAEEVALPLQAALDRAGPRPENWDSRLPGLVTLLWVERFGAVEAMLTAMLAEAERSGSARGLHNTYVTLGLLKLLLGALPEADAAARVALGVLQAGDFAEGLSLVVSVLAEVAVEAGDLGGADAVLDMVKVGELPPTVSALRMRVARARLRMAQDRPAEALAELEACRVLFKPRLLGVELPGNGFPQLRSRCAQALLRLDRREEARELVNSELDDARAFGAPRALGVALRVSGLVHGGEEGLRLLEESVAVLRQSPAVLERAHSLAELGAALRRAGRRTEARAPLAEALEFAARCGARPLAARAREELQATGARPRREWRTGVEALTPSELRVARLAAEGKTNREIAQTLYVTLKTVEAHLASTYGKLAIAGRSELMLRLEGAAGS